MKQMKKLLAVLMAAVMLTAALSVSALAADKAGLDNFKKTNEWKDGTFSDVTSADWFYENVKAAYELGLMIGQGDKFGASSSITVAETVTLAARLYAIYTADDVKFEQGSPWYQVYADYVEANKIADLSGFSMQAAATRAQFAYILASALPAEALKGINTVTDDALPDVKSDDTYAGAIYGLYRAGVLTGNDALGTFLPGNTIKRSEVAAIVTRMADESLRKETTLLTELVTDAWTDAITVQGEKYDEETGKDVPATLVYSYAIPKINIKGEKIVALNEEIMDTFLERVQGAKEDAEEYGVPTGCAGLAYEWYVNGDVLSLLVTDIGSTEFAYGASYYAYNVSISNGEVLSADKVAELAGYGAKEYEEAVGKALGDTYKSFYELTDTAMEEVWNECLTKTTDKANIERCTPFINGKGELGLCAYVYVIAGPETINLVISIPNTAAKA